MTWVIKRSLALRSFFSLLLAFQFFVSPVIFSSRGFDLPRLKGSSPSITTSSSQDLCLIYSVFTAHHKRSGSRHQTHRSPRAVLSKNCAFALARTSFDFNTFQRTLSVSPAPFYPPPAAVLG